MPRKKATDFDNYKYQQQYIKDNVKFVNVPFNSKYPEEMKLYDHLNEISEKKAAYIKRLIREDMESRKTMEKTYKIKPEYLYLWGEDATEETVLTDKELETIVKGWNKTLEDVLEQLIPQNQ